MPMEASSAASDRRIYERAVGYAPICFRLSAPSSQSCVHDQTPHVQDLLRLWTGIRLKPPDVRKERLLPGRSLGAEGSSCSMKPLALIRSPFRKHDEPDLVGKQRKICQTETGQ
jgi:hypothetical protein